MTYKIKRKVMEGYIPLCDKLEKQLDNQQKCDVCGNPTALFNMWGNPRCESCY